MKRRKAVKKAVKVPLKKKVGRPSVPWKSPEQLIEELKGKNYVTPLEYMIAVINDPKVATTRRDEFAKIAVQYMYEKKVPLGRPPDPKPQQQPEGKKAERDRHARETADENDDFAPPPPPRLRAVE